MFMSYLFSTKMILKFLKKKKQKDIDFKITQAISGDYNNIKNQLKNSSLIILIIGKRGSGKSALGFKLLEAASEKRKAYYLGKAKLPRFIKKVSEIKEVKNNSIVLVDEATINYSSRSSMKESNKILGELMAIARHKNLSLIIITQNSAMIDLNVMRLSDVIIFKEPSLLQSRFERKSISDLFKKAKEEFKKINEDKRRFFYIISDEFEGILEFSLPKFWSDRLSKSFAKFNQKP